MACVYILKSLKNGSYYVGSTINIENRLIQHNSGKSRYTSLIRPLELVFSQNYDSLVMARRIEFRLKKFKNRNIIEKIINDGFIKIKDA